MLVQNTPRRQWTMLVPGQVYLIVGIGEAASDDALDAITVFDQECLTLLNASNASFVHFINDLRLIKGVPPIGNIRRMEYLKHPRLGYYITLGAMPNMLLRVMARMISGMVRLRYSDVTRLEEAYTLLLAKDPSLPPLETWTMPSPIVYPHPNPTP